MVNTDAEKQFQKELEQKTSNDIPKLYETDGTPFAEKIIHQIWMLTSVNFVWYVAELDPKTKEAFGYANLNNDDAAEWGYIDIADIKKNGANLIASPAMPFADVSKLLRPKNGCPKCGSHQYGYQSIKREDPTLTDDTFELWICRNCNYQPFTDIPGLI